MLFFYVFGGLMLLTGIVFLIYDSIRKATSWEFVGNWFMVAGGLWVIYLGATL